MSALPEIDATKLAKKLAGQVSELIYQKSQLEVLAEALRDERDSAIQERDRLAAELAGSSPEAHNITSLKGEPA